MFQSVCRRVLAQRYGNLASLHDPYVALRQVLKGHDVTGILDAGASNGRVSSKLLKVFPSASSFMFEPNPAYREGLLAEATKDHRLKPQFYALADKRGTVDLQVASSAGVTSLFDPGERMRKLYPNESKGVGVVSVEAVTIDSWHEQNGRPEIQLMKFDIQGAEKIALQGAKRVLGSSVLVVYSEVFFNPLYDGGAILSDIDLVLRDSGFLLFNLYKIRAGDDGVLMQANAIFVHGERMGM